MQHKCDEHNLLLIAEQGTLTIYKCPVYGKEFCELGSIVIDNVPMQKCKLYVRWSKRNSIVMQVNALKNIIPSLKNYNGVKLLNDARKSTRLYIGEMYLSEAQELEQVAEAYNISLEIEEL